MSLLASINRLLGSSSSGNYGHKGRPGQVGGSGNGWTGGDSLRPFDGYLMPPDVANVTILFHGTASASLESIRKNGLIPKGGLGAEHGLSVTVDAEGVLRNIQTFQIGNREGSVFMAYDSKSAQEYARWATKANPGSKAVLLVIQVPKGITLKGDEFDAQAVRFNGVIPSEWIRVVGPDGELRTLEAGDTTVYAVLLFDEELKTLGSSESGNFGHVGRPGQIGGSGKGQLVGGKTFAQRFPKMSKSKATGAELLLEQSTVEIVDDPKLTMFLLLDGRRVGAVRGSGNHMLHAELAGGRLGAVLDGGVIRYTPRGGIETRVVPTQAQAEAIADDFQHIWKAPLYIDANDGEKGSYERINENRLTADGIRNTTKQLLENKTYRPRMAGSSSSGNHGHAGRPGQVGGSGGMGVAPRPGFVLRHEALTTEEGAQAEFERAIEEQYPDGLTVYHESPIENLESLQREGLYENSFATIGKPSDYVIAPHKVIVKIQLTPEESRLVSPDMRFTPEQESPDENRYANLLREHNGVYGADISINTDQLPPRRLAIRTMGNANSGNYGHAGRPGQIGGSAPKGGTLSSAFSATDIAELQNLRHWPPPKTDEERTQNRLARRQTSDAANPVHVMGMDNDLGGETNRYIMAYGEEFKTMPLPSNVRKGVQNECYKNASLLVIERPDLTYVEGWAQTTKSGGIAFMHGWTVDKDGNVIDPTFGNEGHSYFGVKYDRTAYLKQLYKAKFYGVTAGDAKSAQKAIATGAPKLRATIRTAGSASSGNFNHAGRPGQVGGSGAGHGPLKMPMGPRNAHGEAAYFIGWQEGFDEIPNMPLYNVDGGPRHMSTVSTEELVRWGIPIPENLPFGVRTLIARA